MRHLTRRLVAGWLALALILGLAACAGKEKTAPRTGTGLLLTNSSDTPEENGKQEEPVEAPKAPEKPRSQMSNKTPIGAPSSGAAANAQQAIEDIRRGMEDSPQMALAVASIGYFDGALALLDWVQQCAPEFVERYPFVLDISEERIVGDDWGEVFCLVPRDDATSLAINRISWTQDDPDRYPSYAVEDILYRTDYAAPMLLVVGYDEALFLPTMELCAASENGAVVSWTPELFEGYRVMDVPFNEDYDELIYDFSLYSEDWTEAEDDWWLPPTEAGLMDTVWLTDDGWALAFTEVPDSESGKDTGFLKFYYQIGGTYGYFCYADWELVGDMLVMGVFSGAYSILASFYVLIDPSGEALYISQALDGALFYDENGPADPAELEDLIYPSFFGTEVTSTVLTRYSGNELVFIEE